jgi:hypothetical protein
MLAFKISDYRSQLEAEFALAEAVEEAKLSAARALRVEIANHAHNVPRDWTAERALLHREIDAVQANLQHAIEAYFAVFDEPAETRKARGASYFKAGKTATYILSGCALYILSGCAFLAFLSGLKLGSPENKSTAVPDAPRQIETKSTAKSVDQPVAQPEKIVAKTKTSAPVAKPETIAQPESVKSAQPETIAQPETDVRPQEAAIAQPETITQRRRDARPGEFSQEELDALAAAPVQKVSTSETPKEPWKFPEYNQPEPIVAKTKNTAPVDQPETIAQPESVADGVGPKPYGSCREAHSMGLGDIPEGHPWYRIDQDRDGDGFACDR